MARPASVDYRPIREGETGQALRLWSRELADSGVRPADLRREFLSDADRLRHTVVAVGPLGRVVAAAWYEPRLIRDSYGAARRVGCVTAVATRRDSRSQGHASRLMTMLVEEMLSDGCVWAMLFTRIPEFYERLGWRRMRTRYRQGMLSSRRLELSANVRPLRWAQASLTTLGEIHALYNAERPLTLVRGERYWAERTAPRLRSPGGQILAACEPESGDISGYAVVGWHPKDEAFEIYELCVRPGSESAIRHLAAAVAAGARTRGIVKGRVYAPSEPAVDSVLGELFTNVYPEWWELAMARPVTAEWTHTRIQAVFDAPGAVFWPLDDF